MEFISETNRGVIRTARSLDSKSEPRCSEDTNKNGINFQQTENIDEILLVEKDFDVDENNNEEDFPMNIKRFPISQPRRFSTQFWTLIFILYRKN